MLFGAMPIAIAIWIILAMPLVGPRLTRNGRRSAIRKRKIQTVLYLRPLKDGNKRRPCVVLRLCCDALCLFLAHDCACFAAKSGTLLD